MGPTYQKDQVSYITHEQAKQKYICVNSSSGKGQGLWRDLLKNDEPSGLPCWSSG